MLPEASYPIHSEILIPPIRKLDSRFMDLPSLDFRLLTVLDRLIALRSVTKVAHELQMPQATLSRCLSQLRDHFHDPLFVRTQAGLAPTPAAVAAAEPVRAILDIYRNKLAYPDRFEPISSTRRFAVAASDLGHLLILPQLEAMFARSAPAVRLHAYSIGGERPLIDLLETGEADVAVGGFPALYAGIRKRALFTERYVCAVRSGHPLARHGNITENLFKSLRHVVVSARSFGHVHQAVEKQLTELLPDQAIVVTSQSFVLAALIAERSDLVLTTPSKVISMLDDGGRFSALATPWLSLPSFGVALYWHERFDQDQANRWLRGCITSLAPGFL
jgi:DNA-binding transcriptional LysR family regulator